MSKKSEFLEYVLEQLEVCENISYARMFGGYVIRKNSLPIALIFDNEIYFKVNESNKEDYKKLGSKPFTYEKKGKTIEISNWKLPIEILEDPEELKKWVEKSYQVSLATKRGNSPIAH